jgi:hypothetical protein
MAGRADDGRGFARRPVTGLATFVQLKNLPVHASMLEVSG